MKELLQQLSVFAHEALRYRWRAILAAWVLAMAGWAVVGLMPNQYTAEAKVYIDTESMLKPLLEGLAVDDARVKDRLGAMKHILLSRPNLEAVAKEIELFDENLEADEREEQLLGLVQKIDIEEGYSTNDMRRAPDIYTISGTQNDPKSARRLVESLLNAFMGKTEGHSRQSSSAANRFLEKQIKLYEKRLAEAENRVQQFKEEHSDVLPSQGRSYFERLQAARSELSNAELELRQATQRRDELKRQLENASKMNIVVGQDGLPIRSPLEERISALQARLDELSSRYTPNHPDYIETQSSLAELKRQLDEKGNENSGTNPVVQQMNLSLGEAEADVAELRVRREEYKNRVENLRKQMKTLPKVEAELQRLTRDYEGDKERYSALLERKASAEISTAVGNSGQGVEFRIIEPPRLPLHPSEPDRLLMNTLVFLASIGAGVGLALVISQVNPAVYTRETLEDLVGVEVIGVVSKIRRPEFRHRERRDKWLLGLSLAALGIAFIAVTVIQLGLGGGGDGV